MVGAQPGTELLITRASADLMRGVHELDEAMDEYARREAYYANTMDEYIANPAIAKAIRSSGEVFRIPLARKAVDAVVHELEIASITVPGNEVATKRIAEIRQANQMRLYEDAYHKMVGIYGDAYAVVWYVEDPDDEVLSDELGRPIVEDEGVEDRAEPDEELAKTNIEIVLNNPLTMRVIYDDEHPTRKRFAIKRWMSGKVWRATLYYPGRIERWVTKRPVDDCDGSDPDHWEPYTDDGDAWPLFTDHDEMCVFHFRSAAPYGEADHEPCFGLQNALNKALVTLVSSTDGAGFPSRWGLTDPASVLDQSNDDEDFDDDRYAVDSGGGPRSTKMRDAPGHLQILHGMRAVGEWSASDPKYFLDPLRYYGLMMALVSDTPPDRFAVEGDPASGRALDIARGPFNARVATRKLWLGATWAELWKFALMLDGITVDAVDVQWRPPRVIDDLESWQIMDKKAEHGVPEEQRLIERGYLPEQAKAWLDNQAEAMDAIRRMRLLREFADAVASLSSSVAAGLLEQQFAMDLIRRLATEVSGSAGGQAS
jgi:hypothetical protein